MYWLTIALANVLCLNCARVLSIQELPNVWEQMNYQRAAKQCDTGTRTGPLGALANIFFAYAPCGPKKRLSRRVALISQIGDRPGDFHPLMSIGEQAAVDRKAAIHDIADKMHIRAPLVIPRGLPGMGFLALGALELNADGRFLLYAQVFEDEAQQFRPVLLQRISQKAWQGSDMSLEISLADIAEAMELPKKQLSKLAPSWPRELLRDLESWPLKGPGTVIMDPDFFAQRGPAMALYGPGPVLFPRGAQQLKLPTEALSRQMAGYLQNKHLRHVLCGEEDAETFGEMLQKMPKSVASARPHFDLARASAERSTVAKSLDRTRQLGSYITTVADLLVNEEEKSNSSVIATLHKNTRVNVLEYAKNTDNGKVRARIESPAGWLSAWTSSGATPPEERFIQPQEALLRFNVSLNEGLDGFWTETRTWSRGAVIYGVRPDSEAERLGCRVGDIIYQVNGKDVSELPVDDVANLLMTLKPLHLGLGRPRLSDAIYLREAKATEDVLSAFTGCEASAADLVPLLNSQFPAGNLAWREQVPMLFAGDGGTSSHIHIDKLHLIQFCHILHGTKFFCVAAAGDREAGPVKPWLTTSSYGEAASEETVLSTEDPLPKDAEDWLQRPDVSVAVVQPGDILLFQGHSTHAGCNGVGGLCVAFFHGAMSIQDMARGMFGPQNQQVALRLLHSTGH